MIFKCGMEWNRHYIDIIIHHLDNNIRITYCKSIVIELYPILNRN